jgi:hypothetical protein
VWAPDRAFSRDVAPCAPRHPVVPRLRAQAEAPGNPAVRASRRRHCAPTANDAREVSRPVPRGLCALTGGRTAIPHWPPVRHTSPPPPRPCLSSYRPRRCVTTASMHHQAYKAPLPHFLARPSKPRSPSPPPLAPPVNSHPRLRS